jgi:cell division protease FtsH
MPDATQNPQPPDDPARRVPPSRTPQGPQGRLPGPPDRQPGSPERRPPPPEGPGGPPRKPEGTPPRSPWTAAIGYALLAIALVWLWQQGLQSMAYHTISYREFKERLAGGDILSVEIGPNEIEGKMRAPAEAGKAKPGGEAAAPAKPEAKGEKPKAPEAKTAEKAPAQPAEAAKPGTQAPAGKPTLSAAKTAEKPVVKPGAPPSGEEAAGAKGAAGAGNVVLFRTVRVEDPSLLKDVEKAHIDYTGTQPSILPQILLAWVLPLGLLALLWFGLFRRMGGGGASQAVLSFGKSRAHLVADRDVGVTFADVAGCDEAKAELAEIVEFLRRPEHFTILGAKIPKGVLLVGPPGTGKTLMARAVAGEAKVPFFSLSGSDFVEMFVGVGAARVRDLFQQAKKHAPCIVFVDELDAIGRARGVHLSNINDEREHTLNQLLVEMDGFEPNSGVEILAATNRPDVLDPALLRPGRFDRQVVLDAPDVVGREAILRVHARGKRLGPDVDLGAVARSTPGFSGADLANALNEAALLAGRLGRDRIGQREIEEAVEKVVAGPERKSRRLDDTEKQRVAYHEVGHALVAIHSIHADPVHKISIVPRGRAALGYTLQLPTGEHHLLTTAALRDRLRGLLGGRAAEEVVFGDVSTGAENDLEMATALARRLVCQFGMGKAVGLMHVAREPAWGSIGADGILQRDCSEETAHAVDEEVRALLDEAYADARRVLVQHRDQLERVSKALLERETIDEPGLRALLAGPA